MKKRIGILIGIALLSLCFFVHNAAFAQTEGEEAVSEGAPEVEAPEYEKLLDEARDFLAKGELEKASKAAEEAKDLAPENSTVVREVVDIYLASDEEKAEELLGEILTGEGLQDLKGWATIAYYKSVGGKKGMDKAIEKLEKAAKDKPKDVSLQKSVAEGYVRLKNWDKVVKIYEKLAKENPDDSSCSVRLTDYYALQGNYDMVMRRLEPTVKNNPADIGASDTLLNTYVKAGKVKEAIALFKERLKEDPGSPGLLGRYAQALTNFGMLKEARAEWQKAFTADPTNLLFKQRIGEMYLREGDKKRARKQFEELSKIAVDINPRYKAVAEGYLAQIK